jgi:DNA invertase Pin-like site-specific DNA recombinase
MKHLQDFVYELKARGVALKGLKATEQPIGTRSAAGAFLDLLGVFAEFETTNLRRGRERQLDGIALAKARGVYRGRMRSR